MATEIERKFLVVGTSFRREAARREVIMQAYLSSSDWIIAIRDGDIHLSNMNSEWIFPVPNLNDWATLVEIADSKGQITTTNETIVRARSYAVFEDPTDFSECSRTGGLISIKSPTELKRDDGTPIVLEVNIETGGADSAERIMDGAVGASMIKTRWHVPVQEHSLEVDEFLGANHGLVVAELEYHSLVDPGPAELPVWVGKEVTGVARYYNSELAKRPFTEWSDDEKTSEKRNCGNCDVCSCRVR